MGRAALLGTLAALALGAAAPAPAEAASWAQPQIRVVVRKNVMGPSVAAFRARDPLTRGALAQAMSAVTGVKRTSAQPDRVVLMWELDRALVRAAGLLGSAQHVLTETKAAGLAPPARIGTEVVARLLGLRYDHPSQDDGLELRPRDKATRAEAAYSFAKLLELNSWTIPSAKTRADALHLPALTDWQRRILRRAVSFVGFPYVWGGTSEKKQTLFGVTSRGGFDCSGFAWRIYRLQSYTGAPQLSTVLRGRTASAMAGEVPVTARVKRRSGLKPGDLVFFSEKGTKAKPRDVSHMGIYAGGGWFVHSSSQGTTMTTLSGWYADRFAWGRRPLREAGLR
jgi:cell wall-associated NlpC family hydrolase